MKTLYHPLSEQIKLSSVLYALSDPTRLGIVKNLAAHSGEYCCREFDVSVAKSTMSHHFRVLRESGIIKVRIEGNQRFVSLRCEDLETRFPGLLKAIIEAPEIS